MVHETGLKFTKCICKEKQRIAILNSEKFKNNSEVFAHLRCTMLKYPFFSITPLPLYGHVKGFFTEMFEIFLKSHKFPINFP